MACGIVVPLDKHIWVVIDFFCSAMRLLFRDFQKISFQDNLSSVICLCLRYKANNIIVFLFVTNDEQIKEKHHGLHVNFTFFKCETR